jgi:hypothetical protein
MEHEIVLSGDYAKKLQNAKPIILKAHSIQRKGALGALKTVDKIEEQRIPPLNAIIQFNSTLPQYKLSDHRGLSALDNIVLPENFNWRNNGGDKSALLSKPENQMLCGSCWAISVAGIVADNHVVAGTVTWKPNLSTTWCLANYPQLQCKGGNPALLLDSISKEGIATNNCIDYSWCSENQLCNGKATGHFKETNVNLSELIPDPGCYDASVPHYIYYIDPPTTISLNDSEMNPTVFTNTVKKHITVYGPVQGGFLVYKNFMNGAFSKINGGVYLETGIYDNEDIKFDKSQLNEENYLGSHAIAIIGWGIEKGIIIDNAGTKKDVPYWYCRNSWTEKWADGGYFKMAMYPYNKIVQFDNVVTIKTQKGSFKAGGIVMLKATKKPEYKTLEQIDRKFLNKLSNPITYYSSETKDSPKPDSPKPDSPKPDSPKPDSPKPDSPKPDSPKPDSPNPDSPNPDSPNPDSPNPDSPNISKNNISIKKYIFIAVAIIVGIGFVVFVIFLIKKYYFTKKSSIKQLPDILILKQPEIKPIKPITQIPIKPIPTKPTQITQIPIKQIPTKPTQITQIPIKPIPTKPTQITQIPIKQIPTKPTQITQIPIKQIPTKPTQITQIPIKQIPTKPTQIKPTQISTNPTQIKPTLSKAIPIVKTPLVTSVPKVVNSNKENPFKTFKLNL